MFLSTFIHQLYLTAKKELFAAATTVAKKDYYQRTVHEESNQRSAHVENYQRTVQRDISRQRVAQKENIPIKEILKQLRQKILKWISTPSMKSKKTVLIMMETFP